MLRLSNARTTSRFSNGRIGTKLAIMSVLGIVLIAGMVGSQMLASTSIRSVSSKSSASLTKARNLEAIEAAERGMQVAVGDIRFADGGADLRKGGKLLATRQKAVDALLNPMIAEATPAEREQLKKIKSLIDSYASVGKEIVTLQLKAMSSDGTDAALKASDEAQDKFKQLPPTVANIERGIGALNNLASREAKAGFAAVDASVTSSNRIAMSIGLLAALVMIGSAVFGAMNIAKPLRELVQPLKQIAGGNFAVNVPGRARKDEVGQIADAVATMAEKVSATIAGIKVSGREVTNASAEIAISTTDLSQRTEEQAASLEETTAALEQLSATVKKNADNAQHASQSAGTTRGVADRGGEVVAQAVQAMAKIEESARKISDIIGVIDEIARQTNLLALNAAVEAARAGEAGRGFAVVASEVRALAQRSSQAAKDIKELITNSNGQVKEGVELVNRAGTSLNEIVESIKSVADIVADIANASAEQATGIEEINRALTQMDQATQQNSALVEENAATAKTLEHQAKAMDERVAFFQVSDMEGTQGVHHAEPAAMPAAKAKPAAPAAQLAKPTPAPKHKPVAQLKQVAAGKGGGAVRKMQESLASAVGADSDWKEF